MVIEMNKYTKIVAVVVPLLVLSSLSFADKPVSYLTLNNGCSSDVTINVYDPAGSIYNGDYGPYKPGYGAIIPINSDSSNPKDYYVISCKSGACLGSKACIIGYDQIKANDTLCASFTCPKDSSPTCTVYTKDIMKNCGSSESHLKVNKNAN